MRAVKVSVMAELAAHYCIIGALMPDRQAQISYRHVCRRCYEACNLLGDKTPVRGTAKLARVFAIPSSAIVHAVPEFI
jgi:hypothetical protein